MLRPPEETGNLLKDYQNLYDFVCRMTREFEDLLWNLDYENISAQGIRAYNIKTDELEVGKNIKMGEDAVIDWNKVMNEDGKPILTKITKDGVYTGEIVAKQINTDGLVMKGSIVWETTDTPVQSQYSVNGASGWHDAYNAATDKFMRMKFAGQKEWSEAVKIVGTDGKNGTNGKDGSDATVNDENVFNALTGNGKFQGVFGDGNGNIYINANYIKSGTINANLIKAGTLSADRINGGTLSGVTVDVDTNATIGKKLVLRDGDSLGATITIDNNQLAIAAKGNRYIYINTGGEYVFQATPEDTYVRGGSRLHLGSGVGNSVLVNDDVAATKKYVDDAIDKHLREYH